MVRAVGMSSYLCPFLIKESKLTHKIPRNNNERNYSFPQAGKRDTLKERAFEEAEQDIKTLKCRP